MDEGMTNETKKVISALVPDAFVYVGCALIIILLIFNSSLNL
jgi:preprotein translocase subunit Sec61beta